MFEQAVLAERPAARRYWAVMIGFTGELLAIGCVLMAPLFWPQLLPRAAMLTWITLPPAPRPIAAKSEPSAPVHAVVRPWQMVAGKLMQPVTIPNKVALIDDPPSSAPGVDGGITTSDLTRIAVGVLDQVIRIAPPARTAEPVAAAQSVKPVSAQPPRYKVGGLVHLARLVHRVEPTYPMLARQARIAGTVELTGVIGTDGRIRELRVVRGHPFLANAALEAVRQWVYEPTLLNGEPIEVIAPITVNFRLN